MMQMQIHHEYFNDSDQPIETIFYMPTDPEMAICELRISIDDRTIEAKVMGKG